MSLVRHLQQRHKELQQQYDLLSEKIRRLWADFAIQAGTLVAYQLEKEIERVEAERDRLKETTPPHHRHQKCEHGNSPRRTATA